MKKTLLLASVFAVGAAFATEFTSANALGVLQVAGSSKPKKVLLSVPFAGYGKDAKIKVSELVETSNLPAGTVLRVACDGGYYVWKLSDTKDWAPQNGDTVINIAANGQDQNGITTPSADAVTIGRGHSFWLELPSDTDLSHINYTLIGQQDISETSSIQLVGRKWNLVGNPNVEGYNVVAKITGTRAEGDSISVQDANTGKLKTYRYSQIAKTWICGRTGYPQINLNKGDGCWVYVNSDASLEF